MSEHVWQWGDWGRSYAGTIVKFVTHWNGNIFLSENGSINNLSEVEYLLDCTGWDWKPSGDEIDDGGTAFPAANDRSTTAGMSLRDWFAGQALPALIYPKTYEVEKPTALAKLAYSVADAMIRERNK